MKLQNLTAKKYNMTYAGKKYTVKCLTVGDMLKIIEPVEEKRWFRTTLRSPTQAEQTARVIPILAKLIEPRVDMHTASADFIKKLSDLLLEKSGQKSGGKK